MQIICEIRLKINKKNETNGEHETDTNNNVQMKSLKNVTK